jgi:hypothetical protein
MKEFCKNTSMIVAEVTKFFNQLDAKIVKRPRWTKW